MSDSPRIAFLASSAPDAQQALQLLSARHGQHAPEDADVICPLGGDGFMLQTLHRHGGLGRPVYGMKLGTVGFLMNHHRLQGLLRVGRRAGEEGDAGAGTHHVLRLEA